MDRRLFLKAAASATAAAPFSAFIARAEAGASQNGEERRKPRGGYSATYGPLAPVRDQATGLPLLMLPERFSYISFGWTGDYLANGSRRRGRRLQKQSSIHQTSW